jgi:anti-sigma B factor antagonist
MINQPPLDVALELDSGLAVTEGTLLRTPLYDGVLVTLRGDWDLTNASALRTELLTAVHAQPRALVVDMSDVTFLDSTALGALVAAWRGSRPLGVSVRLVTPSSHAAKVLRITGVDRLLPAFPDAYTALTAR